MRQLLSYYAVGALNTGFGYGVYALLVFVGLNLFLAQFLATLIGVAFNYVTYSRAVFRHSHGAIGQFIAAYSGQYLLSVAALAVLSRLTANPYFAGLGALIFTSLVFYFALKRWVFRPVAAACMEPVPLTAVNDDEN